MSAKLLVIYGFALFHAALTLTMAVVHWRRMRDYLGPCGFFKALLMPPVFDREGKYHRRRVYVYLVAASLSLSVTLLVYILVHGRV